MSFGGENANKTLLLLSNYPDLTITRSFLTVIQKWEMVQIKFCGTHLQNIIILRLYKNNKIYNDYKLLYYNNIILWNLIVHDEGFIEVQTLNLSIEFS